VPSDTVSSSFGDRSVPEGDSRFDCSSVAFMMLEQCGV
jgi:hypothetical protein